MTSGSEARRVAVVTGAGRRQGIAAAVITSLAEDGWDVAGVYLNAYDNRMDWGGDPGCQDELRGRLDTVGRRYLPLEADVAELGAAGR